MYKIIDHTDRAFYFENRVPQADLAWFTLDVIHFFLSFMKQMPTYMKCSFFQVDSLACGSVYQQWLSANSSIF